LLGWTLWRKLWGFSNNMWPISGEWIGFESYDETVLTKVRKP